jgi:probable HAF family extracellular repeat protein
MSPTKALVLCAMFFASLTTLASANDAAGVDHIRYRLLPLNLQAVALNNRGEVAGHIAMQAAVSGPDGVGNHVIEHLPDNTIAVDINARGQAVVASSGGFARWFITGPHGCCVREVSDLPGLPRGLNSRGQVVGEANGFAFVTGPDAKGVRLLGRLYPEDTASSAFAINDAGQLVGASYGGEHRTTARTFIAGPQGSALREITGLSGDYTQPYAINARGEVVGQWQISLNDFPRCFVTARQGGPARDIGTLGGVLCLVRGINNRGQVVGGSYIVGDAALHAFVKDPHQDGLVDLNTLVDEAALDPGDHLQLGLDINESGQIIAVAGSGRFYLLTPLHRQPGGQ